MVERRYQVKSRRNLLRKIRKISRTRRAKRMARVVVNRHGAPRLPGEPCLKNDTYPAHLTPRSAAGGSIMETSAGRERRSAPFSTCPRGRTRLKKSRKARAKDPGRIEPQHQVRTAAETAAEVETGRDAGVTRKDETSHRARESRRHERRAERVQKIPRGAGNAHRGEVTHHEEGAIHKGQDQSRAEKGKAKAKG
jgi:hypothetical protein